MQGRWRGLKRIIVENPDFTHLATLLAQSLVAVEKGTKAVISVNFSVDGGRTFNNLRTNFAVEIP